MPQGVSHEGVFGTSSPEARGPMMQRMMSKSVAPAAPAARGGVTMYERPAKQAPREDDAARADVAAIGPRARRRLAPALLALLNGAAGAAVPVTDGRVTVRVRLRDASAVTVRRLEDAGLRVTQSGAGWVVGSVALESLAALAEQRGVERVELP
jgi:hypothetical protein